jgi:transposase-like protein
MKEKGLGFGGRRRFTPQERARVVAEYEGSGLTQRVFVGKHGLSLATLTNWLRAYRRDKPGGQEVNFQPVDLSGMVGRADWAAEVVMADGLTLRLGAQASVAMAQTLLKVLRRSC